MKPLLGQVRLGGAEAGLPRRPISNSKSSTETARNLFYFPFSEAIYIISYSTFQFCLTITLLFIVENLTPLKLALNITAKDRPNESIHKVTNRSTLEAFTFQEVK